MRSKKYNQKCNSDERENSSKDTTSAKISSSVLSALYKILETTLKMDEAENQKNVPEDKNIAFDAQVLTSER